jgi:hypothetical protein
VVIMTRAFRPLVNSGAAAAYRTLFLTMRRLVLGRRFTVRLGDGDVTLTVASFDSRLDVRGLSAGQLTDVTVTAADIVWRTGRFERAAVALHNVHMRPGAPPVLVAATVDVTLDIPAAALDDLFRAAAPRVTAEIGGDGVARLRLARRPRLGHVEVAARLDDSRLWLSACRVGVGSRRWRLPARTPAYPVQLPAMAHDLQLTDVTFAPGVVRVSGRLPEVRIDLPPKLLEDIITQRRVR